MSKAKSNKKSPKLNAPKEYDEVMVDISRVTKVTRGGRQLKFRATMIIGNRKGKVGLGTGKSNEVTGAIQKAVNKAKRNLMEIPIQNGTIPHEIKVKYKSAKILIMPASAGTGIIAGSSIRQVLEIAGVKNVLAKRFGSTSKLNNAKATMLAFSKLRQNPFIKTLQKTEQREENSQKELSKKEEVSEEITKKITIDNNTK